MMPGFSRNWSRTSCTTFCAVRPTALMASEEKRKTSMAPSSAPTKTGISARLMLVNDQPVRHVACGAGGRDLVDDDGADLFKVGGEEQEGRERGGADGVALGERLGGVAGGVELVGLVADGVGLVGHLDDAAGVVGDGAEGVHGEDVGRGGEHAHGGDGGAVDALGVVGDAGEVDAGERADAAVVAAEERDGDDDDRKCGRLHADGEAGDDVGGRAGERGFGDELDRTVAALGVVLGDPDEEEGGDEADDAAGEEPAGFNAGAVEHLPDDDAEARERDDGGDVEAAVERVHRVFGLFGAHDGDADGGGDEVDGVDDQREEDALDAEDGIERSAEDHGADGFGGGGLEDVGTAAGAVADVVTDEVGDDGGVAGIVFGDAGFDLADEVGADVSGLGVDAAAELGEERDERGSEAEADELVDDRCRDSYGRRRRGRGC